MQHSDTLKVVISAAYAGNRLDSTLATLFPQHSRNRLQHWIRDGAVRVNCAIVHEPRHLLQGGEKVEVTASFKVTDSRQQAEAMPLDIRYRDAALMIIYKPPSIVVHPGAGNMQHTLLNALLYHDPGLSLVPRAGIIHRLDKDTSGLMVIARTPHSHTLLVRAMQERVIRREYLALIKGVPVAGGTVSAPIGRHPRRRTAMAVVANGKEALTHYRVLQRYRTHSLIRAILETGRTHQIRVHMAHIGHPLLGDRVYAKAQQRAAKISPLLQQHLIAFPRQALHACYLELVHPITQKTQSWNADLPNDMQQMVDQLAADAASASSD